MSRRLRYDVGPDQRHPAAGGRGLVPRVVGVDPQSDPRWDELVRRHPRAGAYHLGAWAPILAGSYGYEPAYLALETSDGRLTGALPLMKTRGLLTGRRLRSLQRPRVSRSGRDH